METRDTYSKSKELSEKMQGCLRVYADMLGAPAPEKESIYGFVPGLQLSLEQQTLESQLDKLEEGIFQVLFTGGFSAGKSTMLNALMRKDILRTAITAETAVITKIIFGQDESITVFMKDTDAVTGKPKEINMSIKDFFKEYRVSQEDEDKFEKVDYVVLHQPEEGIAGNLVQLVDSPGTENSIADTQAARRFAESANAIVHLINSAMPFILEDKEYIASHYANKHMKNVFFVCNRYDSLDENAQEDLKKSARQQLHDVFTDAQGKFDEELFENRVFYTDAYHSLKARIGEPVKTPMGMMKCDDSVTGVIEFEDALGRYLTADDRDKEAFRSYMTQLASKYVAAMKRIDSVLDDYRKGVDELTAEREDFAGKKEQLESYIDQIEECTRNCVSGILTSAKSEYNSCINRINSGWDSHFSKTSVKFGVTDAVYVATHKNNKAKVKERTKPFAEAIQSYVKNEFKNMGKALSNDIDGYLKQLERQLSILQAQIESLDLPISIDSIRDSLLGGTKDHGNVGGLGFNGGDQTNLFQIILGIIFMDPETIFGGALGGKGNAKVIVETLVKNVVEYIAVYVVAWPLGVAMLVGRLISIIVGLKEAKEGLATKILCGMKDDTVRTLSGEQDRYIMELEKELSTITRAGVTMADGIRTQVEDYEINLDNTIDKLKSKSNDLATETERTDKIKAILLKNISEMNMLLNGAPLTEEQVKELAV